MHQSEAYFDLLVRAVDHVNYIETLCANMYETASRV
jgi:hypothetical protein